MHELSGYCDSRINSLHHCLLSAVLTCHTAVVYVLIYWACGYVKFWLDAGELLWVYLLQPQLTWSASWVSRLNFGILIRRSKQFSSDCAQYCIIIAFCTYPMNFACWALHCACIRTRPRFKVMMWSSDALDPLRRSLHVCASDSISVLCVESIKSWKYLSTLSYSAVVDLA